MKTKEYDLIVVGGGIAGVSAALSATKEGLKTCIIEKGSLLGGLATSGLINWFEPLCDGDGHQLLFSQCEELFELALKYGYYTLDEKWKENHRRKSSWFNHNLFALSLNRLMIENHIDVFYETTLCDAKIDKERIVEIEIFAAEGKRKMTAKQFIDASGNAILSRLAGINVREGINYLTYNTTTYKNGLLSPIFQTSGAFLDGTGHPKEMQTFSGLVQDDVNTLIKEGQLLCLADYENGKFKDISSLPSMPHLRKIASIEGEYCLTKKDLFKHQEDSIGVIGVFNRPKEYYEIPLRCLYSNKIKNLFVAGRIISSDDEGWEAIRVIPVAILTGEVAGVCSSLLINKKMNYINLKNILVNRGLKIHF